MKRLLALGTTADRKSDGRTTGGRARNTCPPPARIAWLRRMGGEAT